MKLLDARSCLGCGCQPRLTLNRSLGQYLVQCSNDQCLWSDCDVGALSRLGAVVRWHRDNKPSCDFTWWRWCCRYAQMRDQPLPAMPVSIGGSAA